MSLLLAMMLYYKSLRVYIQRYSVWRSVFIDVAIKMKVSFLHISIYKTKTLHLALRGHDAMPNGE